MHARIHQQVFRDPWFLSGITLAVFFAAITVMGPSMAPFDPWDMAFAPITPPSGEHLLGINDGGQDIFSELLFAIRNTAAFGFESGLVALALGIFIGVAAGWFGGFVDMVLMRLADVLLAVPAIMILILTAALFRPSPALLALILAGLLWPTISKAIRAQTLSLKESLHVKAARQMGGGNGYIIRRHLIPEMFPLYLIGFSAKARMAMFMEASLAFLGLFDPGRKSLGMMISYALKYYYLDIWWNWLFPPVLCLSLIIMAVTFLAISMEKALDPRLRETLTLRNVPGP
ncbi:MAG: ABC transporter permease [Deltaproteobacteria bacterium]|nr:ABC transporter permease [Deltaproteobacteria bacterium]